ncbi:DUF2087 domain-containing protein [Rudaeicoccus suwonensis]|nr:DUF2087 domain-containing protein [Rudaeicoccus suwonensis]
MTSDRDFKRIVRARMIETGENYTAARAAVLAAGPDAPAKADLAAADAFVAKTIRNFFDGDRLRSMPVKRKARVVVLLRVMERFEPGRRYAEREVNDLLAPTYDDYAFLRRELVDYRYLARANGEYWLVDEVPERNWLEAQEVPVDEAARVRRAHAAGPENV